MEETRNTTSAQAEAPFSRSAAFERKTMDSLGHGSSEGFDQERSWRFWAFDIVVALAAFAFGCVQLLLTSTSVVYVDVAFRELTGMVTHVPTVYAYVAVGFTTLPLVLRRCAPWAVLAITLACFVYSAAFVDSAALSVVGPVVAAFTVARMRDVRQGIAAACISALAVIVAASPAQSEYLSWVMRFQNIALFAAAVMAGFALRMHNAYLSETKRRLDESERRNEELAARRVAEERVRIAREVHDITAHSLSAVAIQAAAAERLIDLDANAAKESISDIRHVAKSSLEEIRSLVGVLRGDEAAEKAPAEGTERMEDVVDYLKKAGIDVEFSHRAYDASAVPAFVDMTLFALAREAATNTVRYAQATKASVTLRSSTTQASLSFSDDGCGFDAQEARSRSDGGGHGLQGMAERIEALHGTLELRSAPGAGVAIEAVIPLEVAHGS